MERKYKRFLVAFGVFLLLGGSWLSVSGAGELEKLIEGARKEGQLTVNFQTSATPELVKGLEAAMNKYYGLNIKVNRTHAGGSYSKVASIAVTEHLTGTKPSFDAIIGGAPNVAKMLSTGAIEPIKNWKELLPKGTPGDDKSLVPRVLKDAGFKFVDNFHILAYNPKLISKADLPKMLKDFGDPKYKGKFAVPPYTGTPGMIMLVYGKEKALDIYRTWGKNKPKVLTYNQGLNRVALGELWMAPYPNSYDVFKQQARGNPIDMVPIQDLVPWTPRYMTVRANAPHINAARLWALFNTGPQAQRIWEKEAKWMNITYPEQSRIKEVIKLIDASGAKIYSWEENEQNFKKLLWYAQTKKGRAYSKKIKSALRKGR